MEFQSLKQLEKKLEYTVDLIGKLKDQTQAKDLVYSKRDQEFTTHRQKEEQLRSEITRLERELKVAQQEHSKRQKELRSRLESVVTRLSVLERSV